MKHQGKALGAAAAMLSKSVLVCLFLAAFFSLAWPKSLGLGALMAFLGFIFGVFVLWFFRDPDPRVPSENRVVVSPAHGKVDVIDELEEPEVMGGRSRRISIFLSVFDVHVQNSPVSGTVHHLKHTPGKFLNALNTDSASHNENVLVGFQLPATGDGRVGIRLIAGLIAVTYSALGVLCIVAFILYPAFWADPARFRSRAAREVAPVLRALRFLPFLAGAIPLVAVMILITASPHTFSDGEYVAFRTLTLVLIALGMAGFEGARLAMGRARAALEAFAGGGSRTTRP